MRFCFLPFLLMLIAAESLQAQNKVGVFAGAQATTASYIIHHHEQPTDFNFGAQAGVTIKIPFENRLYFAPELYYSMKGYKVTLNDPSYPPSPYATNNDTRMHYLDVGATLQYDFGVMPGHFYLKIGPSLEFILSGTEKFDLSNGQTTKQKMPVSFADYGFVTASALLRVGYETAGGLFVFGHYDYGLASINNADDGPFIRHRVIGLSVGTYFKKGKK